VKRTNPSHHKIKMDSLFIPRESIYNLLEKEACVEKKLFLRTGQYKQNVVVGSSTFGMKNNIFKSYER